MNAIPDYELFQAFCNAMEAQHIKPDSRVVHGSLETGNLSSSWSSCCSSSTSCSCGLLTMQTVQVCSVFAVSQQGHVHESSELEDVKAGLIGIVFLPVFNFVRWFTITGKTRAKSKKTPPQHFSQRHPFPSYPLTLFGPGRPGLAWAPCRLSRPGHYWPSRSTDISTARQRYKVMEGICSCPIKAVGV